MGPAIDRLLGISSLPLAPNPPFGFRAPQLLQPFGALGEELCELLSKRNGFYAFLSALLVRPIDCNSGPHGLVQWNSPSLWKDSYDQLFDNVLFFAEDVFGGQFCIREQAVWLFNPEVGEYERIAKDLESWAAEMLENSEVRTGFPLASEWQKSHGALENGYRLLPKLPFVVGGKFEIANMYASQDIAGMRFRGSVANQIRDVPDGDRIIFKVGREPFPPESN